MFLPTIVSLLLLNPAIPTRHIKRIAAAYTEPWLITRLNMHFLSPQTGLPGNPPWPNPLPFNSSITFDVVIPENHAASTPSKNEPSTFTTACHAYFLNGTLPTLNLCTPINSGSEVPSFWMLPYAVAGHRRPEMAFTLMLESTIDSGESYRGGVNVTANDWGVPTMHMSCVGGPPMDGLRCTLVNGPIVVYMENFDSGAGGEMGG